VTPRLSSLAQPWWWMGVGWLDRIRRARMDEQMSLRAQRSNLMGNNEIASLPSVARNDGVKWGGDHAWSER
jgi:hypothetical protein